MNGLTRRWILPASAEDPPAWTAGGTVEPLVARVLWSRGVRDDAALKTFLDTRLLGLHDPSLMGDLDRAAARMLDALRRRERLVIYGDYDVDGVCASAILFHVCRAIEPAAVVDTYVPHRLDEGYGLHADAIRQLAAEGARVVVSVDCGVTAFAPALAARDAGLNLIITDHHTIDREGKLPEAYAVVHPRRPGCTPAYPYPELCGAGVAFKLAWRLATMAQGSSRVSEPMRAVLLDALALASLGTIADVVPLVGENRVIARNGLRRLRSTSIIGLRALIEASKLEGDSIDSEQVGFILGPRLNACGRMGHARDAVELFTTAGPERAREISQQLTRMNDERRRTEKKIFEQAEELARERGMTGDDKRAIVLAGQEWHAGVVGIVCSRLIDRHHRPTILLQESEGVCHGSGRSIDGFNLHGALEACGKHLSKFGGHEMAAGLTIESKNLEAFTEDFVSYCTSRIGLDELIPPVRVDCAVGLSEMSTPAVKQLEDLGPFGRGNPKPRLVLRRVTIARTPEPLGARGAHGSLFVRESSRELRLVGWNWGERMRTLRAGMTLDAVIEPSINRWNGRESVEASLVDVRVAEG